MNQNYKHCLDVVGNIVKEVTGKELTQEDCNKILKGVELAIQRYKTLESDDYFAVRNAYLSKILESNYDHH